MVIKFGSTPKVGGIGNPARAILAKPNRANTCRKKKQSRKDIGLRTVQESDYCRRRTGQQQTRSRAPDGATVKLLIIVDKRRECRRVAQEARAV
jgi:hypothetical protein